MPRKFEEFTLDEISFVKRPAQEPALAAIIKSRDPDLLLDDDFWKQLPSPRTDESHDEFIQRFMLDKQAKTEFENNDARRAAASCVYTKDGGKVDLVTSSVNDHEHGVSLHSYYDENSISIYVSYASSDREDAKRHTHDVVKGDDGNYYLTENHGHTHEIDNEKLRRVVFDKVMKGESEVTKEPDKAVAKLKDELATVKEELATATAVAQLSDVEKLFYEKAEDKPAFLKLSSEERKELINKAEEADPVIYTAKSGEIFRKSDDERLIAMAKRADESAAQVEDLLTKQADASLTARAEEFKFIKGDIDTRKTLLKAIDGIENEAKRKAALEVLKSADQTNAPAFDVVGKSFGKVSIETKAEANDELARLAKERHREPAFKGTYFDAYDSVAKANPELVAKAKATGVVETA